MCVGGGGGCGEVCVGGGDRWGCSQALKMWYGVCDQGMVICDFKQFTSHIVQQVPGGEEDQHIHQSCQSLIFRPHNI